jgi:streptogramin lyase
MVFSDTDAWVVTHRGNTIFRLDLRRNRSTRLTTLDDPDAAAERLALLAGSLWVTGRGMQLVELDPGTGDVRRRLEIGGTGIDVVAASGALWIPVRTDAVDRTGFPTMAAVRRVEPGGSATTAASAMGRVDVNGLAARRGAVWLADNTNGFLYRLPT